PEFCMLSSILSVTGSCTRSTTTARLSRPSEGMRSMSISRLLFVATAAWFASIGTASAGSPNCAIEGGKPLSWPVGAPVWEMCWLGPDTSAGPRGSGLELRAVHYRGVLVAKRIHAPMLFAEYTSGTCYRDWKDDATPSLAHSSTHN